MRTHAQAQPQDRSAKGGGGRGSAGEGGEGTQVAASKALSALNTTTGYANVGKRMVNKLATRKADGIREEVAKKSGQVADFFAAWDTDGDGSIDFEEFCKALSTLDMKEVHTYRGVHACR